MVKVGHQRCNVNAGLRTVIDRLVPSSKSASRMSPPRSPSYYQGLPGFRQSQRIADGKASAYFRFATAFVRATASGFIPDNRVSIVPIRNCGEAHSEKQIYLTAPSDRSPSAGPA